LSEAFEALIASGWESCFDSGVDSVVVGFGDTMVSPGLRADRDDGGHLRASPQVSPREHDDAVQYCSPMRIGPFVWKTAMAADSNALRRLRGFIDNTIGVAPVTSIFKNARRGCGCIVRDPSHMIKKDQLIAGVNATLWLGHRYVRLRADQGLDNEQVRR
jgi:hypothetical protein